MSTPEHLEFAVLAIFTLVVGGREENWPFLCTEVVQLGIIEKAVKADSTQKSLFHFLRLSIILTIQCLRSHSISSFTLL